MNITVSTAELTDALASVAPIARGTKSLAVLTMARMTARGDTLTITTTNLDTTATTQLAADVEVEGDAVLDPNQLLKMCKGLDEPTLSLATEDNHWATIDAGGTTARVTGTHPDDYPQILDVSQVDCVEVPAAKLLRCIDATRFSISTDDARANLTGAMLTADGDIMRMVTTDGHRLSKMDLPCSVELPEMIVPASALDNVSRNVIADLPVEVAHHDGNIVVRQGDYAMSSRLIEGTFPDFAQVLPKPSGAPALVDREALRDAVDFVSIFANRKTNNVRIKLTNSEVELYASDPDSGEGRRPVACDYDASGVKAGYNYKYVDDVLGVLDCDTVELDIIDTLSPTIIRDPSDDAGTWVVMPMRL